MLARSVPVAVAASLALLVVASVSVVGGAQTSNKSGTPRPTVAVSKSPTCGCCAKWNEHMTAAGYAVVSRDVSDVNALKDEHRVPPAVRSCHTALVAGYVIEGHVPADVVNRLLAEKPAGVVGIAVPGMPKGSPGMESPDGSNDHYSVLAFSREGHTRVYASK